MAKFYRCVKNGRVEAKNFPEMIESLQCRECKNLGKYCDGPEEEKA